MINQTLLIIIESLGIMAIITMITAVVYALSSIKYRKNRYTERIKELEKQLELSNKLLEETRKRCEDDVKRLTQLSRPAKALLDALEKGEVKLVHEADNGRVIVLPDGTLVCDKGHVIGGDSGSGEHGVDAG